MDAQSVAMVIGVMRIATRSIKVVEKIALIVVATRK
jgi:hypothetical protein